MDINVPANPAGTDGLDAVFMAAQGQERNSNIAYFYHHPVLNAAKTADAGTEIYEDKEYICIISPGQRLSEIRRKALDRDKESYAIQYKAFLEKRVQPIIGTPLGMLPGITPARVKELEYINIRTVQHLIDMPDSALSKVGPDAQKLKSQAKAFLEKNDPIIIELQERVKKLEAMLESKSAPSQVQQPAKRRGRPPKLKQVNGSHVIANVHSTSG